MNKKATIRLDMEQIVDQPWLVAQAEAAMETATEGGAVCFREDEHPTWRRSFTVEGESHLVDPVVFALMAIAKSST